MGMILCKNKGRKTWNVRPEFVPGNGDDNNNNDTEWLAKKMWRVIYGMPRYEMNVRWGVSSLRIQLSSYQICVQTHRLTNEKQTNSFSLFCSMENLSIAFHCPSRWTDKKKFFKMIRLNTQKQRLFTLETIYRSEYLLCVFSIWRRRKNNVKHNLHKRIPSRRIKLFTHQIDRSCERGTIERWNELTHTPAPASKWCPFVWLDTSVSIMIMAKGVVWAQAQ